MVEVLHRDITVIMVFLLNKKRILIAIVLMESSIFVHRHLSYKMATMGDLLKLSEDGKTLLSVVDKDIEELVIPSGVCTIDKMR